MSSNKKSMGSKEDSKPALTPKLRFPEFRGAGAWAPKLLGDLFSQREESGNTDLRLLSLTDKEGIIPQEDSNRKNNASGDLSKYLRVAPGDIAYNTMRMWEGRSALSKLEGIVSPAYTVCTPAPDANSLFFSYYFKTPQLIAQFARYSQGLVKDTLNLKFEAFSRIPASIPCDPAEQQKIAECLSSFDEVIAAQSGKVDALRTHKKGLMQQLFPNEGETQPRLRFPEFRNAGEWEEKSFSAIVDLISGLHLSADEYGESGEVPYFSGPSDFTDELSDARKWTTLTTSAATVGDTLITVKGSGVGEVWFSNLPAVALGRQLMAIHPKEGQIRRFVFQFLLTKKRRFEVLGAGNLIPGISRSDILGLKVLFPEPPEQQRIADCLTSLDELIAAETQKVDKLKAHKKGLLQQLFPSIMERDA